MEILLRAPRGVGLGGRAASSMWNRDASVRVRRAGMGTSCPNRAVRSGRGSEHQGLSPWGGQTGGVRSAGTLMSSAAASVLMWSATTSKCSSFNPRHAVEILA
ncbi:hypothetical protein EYF80_042952 [Liparis tanakae]|uniref:Uncharacterized protein n=1 Tax=Liparis tanakae TaxID=230148 RepID=A0A4Z2G1S3_9TELE|nr:hypothetical protein EYF80_042952 [Liparis tanakae]